MQDMGEVDVVGWKGSTGLPQRVIASPQLSGSKTTALRMSKWAQQSARELVGL